MSKQKQLTQAALAKVDSVANPGSTAAQIAILSERIANLQAHLDINKKDIHSRRGLLQMVADRRRHIKYLKRTQADHWMDLATKLELKA